MCVITDSCLDSDNIEEIGFFFYNTFLIARKTKMQVSLKGKMKKDNHNRKKKMNSGTIIMLALFPSIHHFVLFLVDIHDCSPHRKKKSFPIKFTHFISPPADVYIPVTQNLTRRHTDVQFEENKRHTSTPSR